MYKIILMLLMLIYQSVIIASSHECSSKIVSYRVVKGSVYLFKVNKEKACFFAFYTTNPEPISDVKGSGNLGDALWYGYYMKNDPSKIYEFPKPSDPFWGSVCSIDAISFYPMHGGKKRDVTVIGSCKKQNAINYTFPFVFVWQGNKFVLDEEVYHCIYGLISLTVADVRNYIKSPEAYFKVLEGRYK